MIKNIKELLGYAVHARDGEIGKAREFYFDDDLWRIRYLLVDAGEEFGRRQILVPLNAFREPRWDRKQFLLNMSKARIRSNPGIDGETIALDRGKDLSYFARWPLHWNPDGEIKPSDVSARGAQTAVIEESIADAQLRGVGAVLGYRVTADDGTVGFVADMLVDDIMWDIRYLAVGIGERSSGKKMLVTPDLVESITAENSEVKINLLRENARGNTTHDVLYEKKT